MPCVCEGLAKSGLRPFAIMALNGGEMSGKKKYIKTVVDNLPLLVLKLRPDERPPHSIALHFNNDFSS